MEVIESVPVHEDIKLGRPSRDALIRNYAETILNLGKAGVKCICYNFMPVFDWLRTDLKHVLPDGSHVPLIQPRNADEAGQEQPAFAGLGRKLQRPKNSADCWKRTRALRTKNCLKISFIFCAGSCPRARKRVSVWRSIPTIRPGICSGFPGSSPAKKISTRCLPPCRTGTTA